MGVPLPVPRWGGIGLGLGGGITGQLHALQLGTFHALWNLYDPSSDQSRLAAPDEGAKKPPALSGREKPPALSGREPLTTFKIGTKIVKPLGDGRGRGGRAGRCMTTIRRTRVSAS